MSTEVGLLIEHVSKDLGGRRIVDDLRLEVRAGELTCLLGPSGCGKTTTMRMIGGFLIPDRGRIMISGRDVTKLSPDKRPTAMVFQNYALWPHMTVFKNVSFGLRLRKLPKAEIKQRVEQVLELVGLTHHIHSYPARISGGEQQRVALARALAPHPAILVADEPTGNLDEATGREIIELLFAGHEKRATTLVLVTHDIALAQRCDRIVRLRSGRIEGTGTS